MLIVLRGNSGSGKSTVARRAQAELGWPTALLQQDHFRRIIYREREYEHLAHIDLLRVAALHCLGRGDHVILDGIFQAGRYGELLHELAARADDARFFAFDLSFEETVRRHQMRPQRSEFTVDQMREWYHGWQPLSFVTEQRITAEHTIEQILTQILAPAGSPARNGGAGRMES